MLIKQQISIDETVYNEAKQFSIIKKDESNLKCRGLSNYIVLAVVLSLSGKYTTYIVYSDSSEFYCEDWLMDNNNKIIEPLYEIYLENKSWKVKEI